MTVFSLSFSLFFSRSLFVSRSVSRVAFPSLFPVRLGGHPTLLWADKAPLFISFFFPTCRHPKPCFWSSFSPFLSLFTLDLVSYSLLIPCRKGPERPGAYPIPLVPQKPRLCISFFVVLLSNARPLKPGFSPSFSRFLSLFTLYLVS